MPHRPQPDDVNAEANLLALRNYFHELTTALIDFEELWYATGQGETIPPETAYRPLLRRIAGRASMMEQTYLALNILRDFPHLEDQKP